LKVGLDNVRAILGQALDALDNNPEILEDLFRTSGEASGGAGRALEGAAAPSEEAPAREAGEDTSPPEPGDRGEGEPNATDAARRKAEELGVDLAQIEGTGAGGRILVTDVRKAAG
jgi:pyruvate/2-oxoglutarate dehydrogenase complex dihydrolipoamide acyltransferase (E2) component